MDCIRYNTFDEAIEDILADFEESQNKVCNCILKYENLINAITYLVKNNYVLVAAGFLPGEDETDYRYERKTHGFIRGI